MARYPSSLICILFTPHKGKQGGGFRPLTLSPMGNYEFPLILKYFFDFFFQPVHTPVNRLFGNLQIPGYFMSTISLDFHQNDLQGKSVHGDQHMIQFLILNTIQKVLYCFQFCLICGCCYGIQICTCSI